ncbi:MAG: insulinase family protein [Calditrichaeota bacterium]|nr:MAG: insulinase family protein [Calditrichota bacterium]
MKTGLSVLGILMLCTLSFAGVKGKSVDEKIPMVTIKNSSPLVSFRILLNVGSAVDPAGKEGVANLTAWMLSEGGTRTMSYKEIVDAMYPMATSFNAQVDKEMTVFYGTTHLDNLQKYYQLIREMLLEPGWREEDFQRLKTRAINFLKIDLADNNDEELGKEALYRMIYQGHPYGHHNVGTIEALQKMTLADLQAFYKKYYVRANLVIGLAGNYPENLVTQMQQDFAKWPQGQALKLKLPQPKPIHGLNVWLVKKNARATAISFGFPIAINRSHPDWPALWLIRSYFGEHRSSNSYLYQRMRRIRGLNYGDYAYIEYFPRGMFQFHPDPNLARQQQIFQVWIRPVEPKNAHFSLRIAKYELDKLLKNGLSQEDFEATRNYLKKFVNVLVKTQMRQLGYAMDSRYYGIPPFTQYIKQSLDKLTLDDVNRVLHKYLQSENMDIVFVVKDAEDLKQRLVTNAPSPIQYNAPKPQAILDEDKIISTYPLDIKPEKVKIIPVEEVFLR